VLRAQSGAMSVVHLVDDGQQVHRCDHHHAVRHGCGRCRPHLQSGVSFTSPGQTRRPRTGFNGTWPDTNCRDGDAQ
jgi:hypothetical protein